MDTLDITDWDALGTKATRLTQDREDDIQCVTDPIILHRRIAPE